MGWNQVIGGFGFVIGVSLVVVGIVTANPVAVYYGGELALIGGVAMMTNQTASTIGPQY